MSLEGKQRCVIRKMSLCRDASAPSAAQPHTLGRLCLSLSLSTLSASQSQVLRGSQAAPEAECGERGRRRLGEDVWALRHSSVYLGREKSTMRAGQEENGLETLLDLPGAGQEGSSCPNGPGPRVGLTRKPSSGGPDLGAARKGKSSATWAARTGGEGWCREAGKIIRTRAGLRPLPGSGSLYPVH